MLFHVTITHTQEDCPGRRPGETAALVGYVAKRADRPAEAYRQVLWALVTSPEFRFTY